MKWNCIPVVALAILLLAAPSAAWILPPNADMMVVHGTDTFFVVTLADSGADIPDGTYGGWCGDSKVYITLNKWYLNANVFSSLNLAAMPTGLKDDEQWDKINYILNNIPAGATMQEVQAAIWYFADATPDYKGTFTAVSQAIVDDANANGAGFIPAPGQVGAVILYYQGVQMIIIVVPVPEIPVPEFPTITVAISLIGALAVVALVARKK